MQQGALSDLKIVEYAHFISGPFSTKLMADLGAEVIKVEEPQIGDMARRKGPFLNDVPHPERSGLFLYLNTNKLGITLNLSSATGVKIFKELVKQADILVENNPPSLMKELGVDYETLKKINPRLIMTSITPFGQTGPYRDYKATNLISMHMGGVGYITPGMVEDPEREPPLQGGGRQAHFVTGVMAATITVAAVCQRQATGLGEHLHFSEYEAVSYSMARDIALHSYEKTKPIRLDSALNITTGLLRCKNGYVQPHFRQDSHWRTLVELMGNPGLADDELFKDDLSRARNWKTLKPQLEKWTLQHTKEEVYHTIQARHVACAPVNTIEEVLSSDHLAARGFFVEISHPETGTVKYPGAPCKLSETPWRVERPAPLLGEHNEDVFCNRLGYTTMDLVKLRQTGIV